MRKPKLFLCVVLIVTLLTMFSGCKKDNMAALLNNLKSIYSKEANRFDIVSSHTIKINNKYESSSELEQSIIDLLPEKMNVDFGFSMLYNLSELRATGYAAGTHETALLFKEWQFNVDMDFDIYANKDEGIYFKSVDAFNLISRKYPAFSNSLSKDGWLKIASKEEAAVIFTTLNSLRNEDNFNHVFNSYLKEVKTKKEGSNTVTETEINLKELYNYLLDKANARQFKLYKRLNSLISSINLSATYTFNENNELTDSTYAPTTNDDTELNKVVKSIDGVIYRFTYESSNEKSLKPDGEYK